MYPALLMLVRRFQRHMNRALQFPRSHAATVSAMIPSRRTMLSFLASKEPTSKQDLVQYANRVIVERGNHMTYNDAEAINDMKVVGLKELRAVTAFTTRPHHLETKLSLELQSRKVPEPVIKGIVSAVDSTPLYSNSFEEFAVDSDGSGFIFKATVMIKPSSQFENHSDVAVAVSGASFNAAKVIDHYHEEVIPQHKLVSVPKEFTERGFFADYKKIVYVEEYRTLDPIVKRTPIFKEKMITNAKLESIKNFLEAKTLGEVKRLYGSRDKTEDE